MVKKAEPSSTKILTVSQLEERIKDNELRDVNVVLVGGCFDIIHYGHVIFLKSAKREGDKLVILLEPDEFINKRKKKAPVHTQKQRAEILAALEFVDLIVLLPHLKSYDEYLEIVKKINPTVIAVTEGDTNLDLKKKQAELINAQVKIVSPLIEPFSSSNILETYETYSRN